MLCKLGLATAWPFVHINILSILCIFIEILSRAHAIGKKHPNDFKFGTFIGRFQSNDAASMAVKGLRTKKQQQEGGRKKERKKGKKVRKTQKEKNTHKEKTHMTMGILNLY